MMNDINTVALTGRLTRNMELRFTDSGLGIGRFSLAVNRSRKRGDKWEEDVSYIDCTLYGKSAQKLEQYLVKGKQVALCGELRQDRWEQDGQTRSRITVIVGSITLIGGSRENDTQSRGNDRSRSQQSNRREPRQNTPPPRQGNNRGFDPPPGRTSGYQGPGPEGFDDDIPF